MVRLQRRHRAAIRAAIAVLADEGLPFPGREGTLRRDAKGAVLLGLGPDDRRVGAVILGDALLQSFRVTCVVRRVLGSVGVWMSFGPSPHRRASLLGSDPHPRAAIGAPLVRIAIWHRSTDRARLLGTEVATSVQ